jgi:hypothetical protein
MVKRMNSKGQIFSVDFVLSMILIVLAIGTTLAFLELNAHALKEDEEMRELKAVGETASDLLVSNPEIVCRLVDNSNALIDYLPNCIPNDGEITKEKLGIPDSFECEIEIPGFAGNNECDSTPASENSYSVKREIVINPTENLSKKNFNSCTEEQICVLTRQTATLTIWRATP